MLYFSSIFRDSAGTDSAMPKSMCIIAASLVVIDLIYRAQENQRDHEQFVIVNGTLPLRALSAFVRLCRPVSAVGAWARGLHPSFNLGYRVRYVPIQRQLDHERAFDMREICLESTGTSVMDIWGRERYDTYGMKRRSKVIE